MRRETPTITLTIVMAGDITHAAQVCRRFCLEGLCVSLKPSTYIYTGGEEAGFEVGLINYPRFPSSLDSLWEKATRLADALRAELAQHSYSIIGPDRTAWDTLRENP
jgi:hypothetical protein